MPDPATAKVHFVGQIRAATSVENLIMYNSYKRIPTNDSNIMTGNSAQHLPPASKSGDSDLTRLEDHISEIAQRSTSNAFTRAIEAGLTVIIAENGALYKVSKAGKQFLQPIGG
jgi:hypothetical protein